MSALTGTPGTPRPLVTHTREEFARALDSLEGRRGLVMTMGALHDGHLELVRRAREEADHVVVTIFVNPTQFAPGEDYDAYPRTLEADVEALSTVGADLVWAPSPQDAYPTPAAVTVDPGPVAHVLEGAVRPTHFAGVALIVLKVLGLTRPDVAFFGEKDAQQLAVLRSVVRDLDVPVEVRGVPIVRDSDGVALSSRNRYLSDAERLVARSLSRGLLDGGRAWLAGEASGRVRARVAERVASAGAVLDYVSLVDDTDFSECPEEESEATRAAQGCGVARLLVAARVGTTRLIDNLLLTRERVEALGEAVGA